MPQPPVTHIVSSLSFQTSEVIANGVLAVAREHSTLPMSVSILDSGGHLMNFKREDGSSLLRAEISFGKAYAVLGMGMSSRTIKDVFNDRPVFQNALAAASNGRFVPVPGGVSILNKDGMIIGAVGVSGDSSECDEFCAIQAIQAAGLSSNPAELDTSWMT
ncbi:MAG: GlcG protein [Magnetovibrio sp.]|nr:GlcG protein [Magnetovibrio sp.]